MSVCLQQLIGIYGEVLVHLSHSWLLNQTDTFIQKRKNLLLLDSNFTSPIRSLTILLSLLHTIFMLSTHQHIFCFSSRFSSRRCGLLWWPRGAGGKAGVRLAHNTWLKVFSCLEFLAFKHNLTWSEKLLHIPGETEVEEERQSLHLTPLKRPFSLFCSGWRTWKYGKEILSSDS